MSHIGIAAAEDASLAANTSGGKLKKMGMDSILLSIPSKTILEEKMKNIITTLLALIATLALVSPLYAMDNYNTKTNDIGAAGISASNLKGMKVISQSGENLGKIESANVNSQNGDVRFVTISKDSGSGMGQETAVPIEALRFDRQKDQATLTVDASKFDSAPRQAGMSDEDFQRKLDSHYGVVPAWESGTSKEKNPLHTAPGEATGLSKPGRYFPDQDY